MPGLRLARRLLRLAALLAAFSLAPAAVAKPPLWVVHSSHGATLVLFGSIHLLPAGVDWRPPALDAALASADELWFELPINPATENEAAQASIARGALPRGRSLTAMMSPSAARRLLAAGLALNCSPEALDRMQPWMADLTLSVAADARDGGNASDGVEGQIEASTPPAARRRAFETAKQQIDFLAGAQVSDQLASLNWTVEQIEQDPTSYRRVVDEWVQGDVAGLEKDAVESLRGVSLPLYERLIAKRNRRWAKVLDDRLKKPGQVVVVVGVGHLIGPDGVPALLRARGYRVEGP
ncbi:MAG TPA: TraB/GumN family protein [Caulobacteraceae bacterium]|jgi:hypothetical protein|nr:TraB/GumN family protein [Caulobacteraceae bacterium]